MSIETLVTFVTVTKLFEVFANRPFLKYIFMEESACIPVTAGARQPKRTDLLLMLGFIVPIVECLLHLKYLFDTLIFQVLLAVVHVVRTLIVSGAGCIIILLLIIVITIISISSVVVVVVSTASMAISIVVVSIVVPILIVVAPVAVVVVVVVAPLAPLITIMAVSTATIMHSIVPIAH